MYQRVFLQTLRRPTTATALRRRALSTRPEPVTTSDTMAQHPYMTMFAGMTAGYFVAMYLERTKFKDEFVRDERHKPVLTVPGGVSK